MVYQSVATNKTPFPRSGAALGENTSTTLDHLLYESGYNRLEVRTEETHTNLFIPPLNRRRMRPNYIGDPVVVYVNLEIK